jgi:peptide/nickel transport system substrate-binding protein
MQAQLAEAGMTVKIKLVDAATQLSDGNSKNFDMISYQWSGRPDPDGNTYQFFKTTPGISLNWSGISNPQIDALLDRTREVSSQAERKKLFSELTRILRARPISIIRSSISWSMASTMSSATARSCSCRRTGILRGISLCESVPARAPISC